MTRLESLIDDLARDAGWFRPDPKARHSTYTEKVGLLIEDWQNSQEVVKAARELLENVDQGEGEKAIIEKLAILDQNRLERGLG